MSFVSVYDILALLVGLVLLAVLAERTAHQRLARSLPPGPKPQLFVGNKIPTSYPWRAYDALTQIYGPVFTIWNGRRPMVVVGRYHAAMELMEKHAKSTGSRPEQFFLAEVVSNGMRILLTPMGERYRRLRRAVHFALRPPEATKLYPFQERAAQNVVKDILADPDAHQIHARRYAASVVLRLAYGRRKPTSYSDPIIALIQRTQKRTNAVLTAGKIWVDVVPWLRYVPGILSEGRQWHRDELDVFMGLFGEVRTKAMSGQVAPCFATDLMSKQKELGLNDHECAYLCGNLFGAGSDTTAGAISVVIMAAVQFQSAQREMQRELDRVVGRARPPSYSDWDDLPYAWAYHKEVMRWRPISAGGFQHATTDEITYGEYVIPAGTTILGNHWSISRDPTVFPDYDTFRPERWLEPREKETDAWVLKQDRALHHVGFGFGRRVCAGSHVADRNVVINIALILWAFSLEKKLDADGRPIEIDTMAFTNTANSHPCDGMPVRFRPRFDGVEALIRGMEGWV